MRNLQIIAAVFLLMITVSSSGADDHGGAQKAPSWIMAYPEHAREQAAGWSKALNSPGAIPPKYRQLIALAVAAQVPCDYCTFISRSFATELYGATDAEMSEAIALAASIRHWSTILAGNQIDEESFQAEVRSMIEKSKAQSEASKTE